MNCPYCKSDMGQKKDLKFCPSCGHKLERCANCGEILVKKTKYCPNDGFPVPEKVFINLPDADDMMQAASFGGSVFEMAAPVIEDVPEGEPISVTPAKSNGSGNGKKIVTIALAAVLIAAFGFGGYFVAKNLIPASDEEIVITAKIDESRPGKADQGAEAQTTNESESESEEDTEAEMLAKWAELVEGTRKMAEDQQMEITDEAEDYFANEYNDLRYYEKASDLFYYLCEAGSIIPIEDSLEEQYLCSYISDRKINQADFQEIQNSCTESFPGGRSLVQMMINEIFAKNGYKFKDQELQKYFDEKEWYQEVKKNTSLTNDQRVIESRMNSTEIANKKFLEGMR